MPSTTPTRILMTADTIGGVWTYALVLADALQRCDVKISLATMGAPLSAEQQKTVQALDNVDVYESRYKLEWMEDPWTDVAAAGEWLLDLETRIQPDLVHLNNFVHGALDWSVPSLIVGHSCVYSWFEAVHDETPPSPWIRYRRNVQRGLRQVDRVTAPTETMLDALERHYGSFARAEAIPNGRAPEDFPPKGKENVIVTAGRLWDEAKNVASLETVAPDLSWPICVAGADCHPDGGRTDFDGLRLLGQLPTSELADWLGRASIFALPARYEPFGLSALEAGLAGCALVLGDIPSLREVWGEAARYVPPDDPDALEATLRRLINDPTERTEMARRARTRALHFSPTRTGDRYVALYANLLQTAQPALSSAG